MEMCLMCLVSLPFLAIHTADLLSKIMRGACYGITSGSLFKNSLFRILKCVIAIAAEDSEFYSL